MRERNIDVIIIGLVFASMPIVKQLQRMFLAAISDFWGRKPFFALSGTLGLISNSTYYLANNPLAYLFGKVVEGSKEACLWAVNRPFLLETSEKKWTVLIHLRTVAFTAMAIGSLLAGFLISWLYYQGTLIFCILFAAFIVPLSLRLDSKSREKLSIKNALSLLDFRKRNRVFRIFLFLSFLRGLAAGFRSGFVLPLFLKVNGFDTETIGLLLGFQIFIAGVSSYAFARGTRLRRLILTSGILYTILLTLLGFSSSIFSGILIILFGIVEGLLAVVNEGILPEITKRESYGSDIGLMMLGLHVGLTLSLAFSGFLISWFGFAVPFVASALILVPVYIISYFVLGEQ
jgi:MFS family permease